MGEFLGEPCSFLTKQAPFVRPIFRVDATGGWLVSAKSASTVVEHLRWLRRWVQEMQSIKPTGLGIDWRLILWDEWARHLKGARTALDQLHASVEASFATQASMGSVVDRMGGIPAMTPGRG
jgi:hypothetical protein